jgi:hypothetical protein
MKIHLIPLVLPLLIPAFFSGASPAAAALAERTPDTRLPFVPFDARVGVLSATPVSAVLHSAAEYAAVVGRPAPADLDFSREWVAFYSAGVQRTTEALASIEAIGLIEDGHALRIVTRLGLPALSTGPGFGRMIPYTMVKFRRPASLPRKVEWVQLKGISLAAH